MIRARLKANLNDYRPVNWPVKHPYWCSGYSESHSIVVAYADDEAEILANWPEAIDIQATEVDAYTFTDRFPKPAWFQERPAVPALVVIRLGPRYWCDYSVRSYFCWTQDKRKAAQFTPEIATQIVANWNRLHREEIRDEDYAIIQYATALGGVLPLNAIIEANNAE